MTEIDEKPLDFDSISCKKRAVPDGFPARVALEEHADFAENFCFMNKQILYLRADKKQTSMKDFQKNIQVRTRVGWSERTPGERCPRFIALNAGLLLFIP